MQGFYEFIWNLFNNKALFIAGAWIGLPLTCILFFIFIRKKNRDERGWKIIGKASIVSFIFFTIAANLAAKIIGYAANNFEIHYLFAGSIIQWLYNSVLLVEISAILILNKIE